jgi:hypothetical protein
MYELIERALEIVSKLERHAEEYGEYRLVQFSEEDAKILREALEQAHETKYKEG